MKVALVATPRRHSGLLEQVPIDRRSGNRANGVEEDANKLALRARSEPSQLLLFRTRTEKRRTNREELLFLIV